MYNPYLRMKNYYYFFVITVMLIFIPFFINNKEVSNYLDESYLQITNLLLVAEFALQVSEHP